MSNSASPVLPVLTERLTASLIDVTPVKATDRVVVIGHGTLPMLLAFLRRGCRMAAELRPDVVAPDAEPADLAWITGVMKTGEYDNALRAALRRIGRHGRLAVDVTAMAARRGLRRVLRWLRGNGLTVDATHCIGSRIVVLAHG
ncbi:hypothetical protein [Ferrovibrio xuzhouensis]|uniref:Uncharacterized protein n=1 Tax=Ferrovibrio xuzhouensis TaxID=1576914 RepID=A0ABV7VDR9_9PROT